MKITNPARTWTGKPSTRKPLGVLVVGAEPDMLDPRYR
jgi:hypothetical protein